MFGSFYPLLGLAEKRARPPRLSCRRRRHLLPNAYERIQRYLLCRYDSQELNPNLENEKTEIKLDEQISIKSILILLKINQSCQLKA